VSSIFSFPQNTEYSVNGLQKKRADIKVGVPCGVLPGSYYLEFTHSDGTNSLFSPFIPKKLFVRHQLENESVKFYYSKEEEYKEGTAYSIGKGGCLFNRKGWDDQLFCESSPATNGQTNSLLLSR